MIKKIFLNGIIVFLISLPIIVFSVYFFRTFWGAEYILNVDQTNITAISEVLAEDNINVDNLNDVNKIEICGAGLNDYVNIKFYYNNSNKISSEHLYDNKKYYIKEYISENTFGYNEIFNISLCVSLLTIGVTIYTSRKKEIKYKHKY